MNFWFKYTTKDIIMTENDKEVFENNIIGRLCEKQIESDKVRDHCHLNDKYRGLAHNTCKINVQQKDSAFFPTLYHNSSYYDCHIFFRKLFDRKKDKVEFNIIPKTNEKYSSVLFGCVRLILSFRFLSSSLDELVGTLVDKSQKSLRKLEKNVDNDELLNIVKEVGEDERTIEESKNDYQDKIEKIEEALLSYMGEKDP